MKAEPSNAEAIGGERRPWYGALVLALVLACPGLLLGAWSQPRRVAPTEMPSLLLASAEIEAALQRDAEAAAAAPSGNLADLRRALYLESGRAEAGRAQRADDGQSRARRIANSLEALIDEEGPEVVGQMRAFDLQYLLPAMRGVDLSGEALAPEARDAELGAFLSMLERYDLVRDGRQVAPDFVVRVLFAARWNALHGRPLVEGMSSIELQTYWGWLALKSLGTPLPTRLQALEAYRRAGGHYAHEARAALLHQAGQMEAAREAFEAAHRDHPTFRLRNHALSSVAPEPG